MISKDKDNHKSKKSRWQKSRVRQDRRPVVRCAADADEGTL